MSELSGQYQKLPPGWDCKYDQTTGNCYYINYFTKVMQLEDPRTNYKQLQNERCSTESIPLQQMHGSGGSPYHVYPSNNPPAMRAFQPHNNVTAIKSSFNRSTSPLLSSRTQLQELSPVPFLKNSAVAQTPRLGNMSRRSTIQETSFTNQAETDAVVAKIQNMFPTASENHIRLLLKRYYNREAVVISALQVEKHPVTMPGPFVTPPAQRHLFHSNSAFYMTPPARRLGGVGSALSNYAGAGATSARNVGAPLPAGGGRFGSVMSMHSGGGVVGVRGVIEAAPSYAVGSAAIPLAAINRDFQGSPRIGDQWRSSPKPHSSPKMKLRYMKTIFPKADEMLLLDILANMDNNVQRASEQLITLGYVKRDFVAHKPNNRPPSDETRAEHEATLIPLRPKEYSDEEKLTMQRELKEKYPQIAEKIIVMALESVNYAEDRAIQILQIVQEEDAEQAAKQGVVSESAPGKQQKTQAHSMHSSNLDECQLDGPHAGGDNILTVVLEQITPTNSNNNNSNNTNSNSNNDNNTRSITDSNIQHKCSSTSSSATTTTTRTPKQIVLPSINVTTPTTATTQIILSNSPLSIHNNNSNGHADDDESATFFNEDEREAGGAKGKKQQLTQATTKTLTFNNYNKLTSKRNSQASILLSTSGIGLNFASSTSSTTFMHNSHTFASSVSASTSASSSAASSLSTLPSSSRTFPTMTTKSILARHPNTYGVASNGLNMGHLHGYGRIGSTSFSSSSSASSSSASSILEKLTATRSRDKIDSLKDAQLGDSYQEDMPPAEQQTDEFQSLLGRIKTMGHNTQLAQGPDENLLLADYVTWNGANPDISLGSKQAQAQGADPSKLTGRSYKAQGRNPELCKGPQAALSKGSIYAQYGGGANVVGTSAANAANIKCN